MDAIIRNLDEQAYRAIKARAALEGRSVGEVINDALRSYVQRKPEAEPRLSIADWKPVDLGRGNENLSRDIDLLVYGVKTR